jgi:NAD(P)H dehydrogenase (quinone)
MRIGISGASGALGSAVLGYLQQRAAGAHLVGVSRTAEKVRLPGVEARRGDFDDGEGLTRAFRGLDRVLLIPTLDMQPGARSRQHTTAVQAAIRAGVEHVVFLSATHTRPGPLNTLDDCYFAPEQELMRTARRWTILRMSLYSEYLVDRAQEALKRGFWMATSRGRASYVARDDVAAAAAGILAGDRHHGAIYNATGADSVTQEEKAALISRLSDKPIPFVQLSQEDYDARVRDLGMPEFVVEVFRHHEMHTARGGFDIVSGDVELLSGRPPRGTAQFLESHLKSDT